MSDEQRQHPETERLTAFSLGRLDDGESAAVERHLADCPACRDQADAAGDDTFVALLRSAAGPAATSPAPGGPAVPPAGVPPELAGHPRYRVLGLLGVGGMGAVYRAEHLLMERPVALKVIDRGLLENPAAVERFRREVRAAARLAHPNIVTAHDADQAGDLHFLVMEHVEGVSLDRLVAERGPLPAREACEYVRQAALGLQHAYERGMVHRDIKPANLMLTPSGQVKVLDFGLARFARESAPAAAAPSERAAAPGASLTQAGTIMGTPDFIAPEQAADPHAADIRADIYSLGCTLYYLLSGHPPFPEGTALDKVLAHAERRPRPLTEVRKGVPFFLTPVVERMMAKNPAGRYPTPAAVASALAPFRAKPPRPRWPFFLLLAAGILFVAVTLLLQRPPMHLHDADRRPAEGREVRRFVGHAGAVKSVAFAPDGRLVLSASGFRTSDQTARVWEVETGTEVLCFRGHHASVCAVAVSPDGRLAASGGSDKAVRVWELATGNEVRCFTGHGGGIGSVAFSPDGGRLVSAGWDGTVRLWDVRQGKALLCFKGHTAQVQAASFLDAGRRVLSGGNNGVMLLWEADTGRVLRRFPQHTDTVSGIALSPDGRQALSAADGVRLWDVDSGRLIRRFGIPGVHVESVAFSPDGRRALTGAGDQAVCLWDVRTGDQLARFRTAATVWSVAFSPDGRQAVSGADDGAVQLWQLPEP